MAPQLEVSTTCPTFSSRAARSTRSTPSRAGTISSSSVLGAARGIGEATCITESQPDTASAQPSSRSRSAAKNESRLPGSAPASLNIARTPSSRASERTVVRTTCPAVRSWRAAWRAKNPEPAGDQDRAHRHIPPLLYSTGRARCEVLGLRDGRTMASYAQALLEFYSGEVLGEAIYSALVSAARSDDERLKWG